MTWNLQRFPVIFVLMETNNGLVQRLLELPIFEAEWVLWLLLGLSLVSIGIMIERIWFYTQHRVDSEKVRAELETLLEGGDYGKAARFLERYDSLETNVVLFGLRKYAKGADAVEALIAGAEAKELQRYNKRLGFLATVGSNAPFIGLFGTVLGVIKAFADLGSDLGGAGGELMDGISEALVATGVGLLVAIPAVIAYNAFAAKVRSLTANSELLSNILLAELKADEPASSEAA